MTLPQKLITIFMVILGTLITRFLPFLLFPSGAKLPNMFNIWEKRCLPQFLGFWWFTA